MAWGDTELPRDLLLGMKVVRHFPPRTGPWPRGSQFFPHRFRICSGLFQSVRSSASYSSHNAFGVSALGDWRVWNGGMSGYGYLGDRNPMHCSTGNLGWTVRLLPSSGEEKEEPLRLVECTEFWNVCIIFQRKKHNQKLQGSKDIDYEPQSSNLVDSGKCVQIFARYEPETQQLLHPVDAKPSGIWTRPCVLVGTQGGASLMQDGRRGQDGMRGRDKAYRKTFMHCQQSLKFMSAPEADQLSRQSLSQSPSRKAHETSENWGSQRDGRLPRPAHKPQKLCACACFGWLVVLFYIQVPSLARLSCKGRPFRTAQIEEPGKQYSRRRISLSGHATFQTNPDS